MTRLRRQLRSESPAPKHARQSISAESETQISLRGLRDSRKYRSMTMVLWEMPVRSRRGLRRKQAANDEDPDRETYPAITMRRSTRKAEQKRLQTAFELMKRRLRIMKRSILPQLRGDLPMPVYSFLEAHDLAGKTVNVFVTHEGSRFSIPSEQSRSWSQRGCQEGLAIRAEASRTVSRRSDSG